MQLMRLCKNVSYESAFYKVWTKDDANTSQVSEQISSLIQKTAELVTSGKREQTTKDKKLRSYSNSLSHVPTLKLLRFFFGEVTTEKEILNLTEIWDDTTAVLILLHAAEIAFFHLLTEEEFFSVLQFVTNFSCNAKEVTDKRKWLILHKFFNPEQLK